MELTDLDSGLKSIATAGSVLNMEELTCLQASLTKLRSQEKYETIYLWGKILAKKSDYYIAYGLGTSDFEFPTKTFFFSGEDYDFKLLPRLTEEVADKVLMLGLTGHLTGEPSAPLGEESELTELERLAQVVQEIDFDTAAVPKGAYALNEAQMVVPSSDFKGLGLAAAKDVANFVHFRPPTSVASLRALAKTDSEFYFNFLDPLLGDLPKGCWVAREDGTGLVSLRSLTWPGYTAFHVPSTTKFGGFYMGYAQKNTDLPFIL